MDWLAVNIRTKNQIRGRFSRENGEFVESIEGEGELGKRKKRKHLDIEMEE